MKISFNHLSEVNQTYTEHAKDALDISFKLFKTSLCALAHAIYPDVFTDSATNTCKEIYENGLKKRENVNNESEQSVLLNYINNENENTENENTENESNKKDD